MAAGKYDFTIEQGATFERKLTFYNDAEQTEPRNMTGYKWRMQFRYSPFSSDYLYEMTSEDGQIITTNQATGEITLKITAEDTETLNFSQALYDLESVDGDVVKRELQGKVTLSREITK